MKISGKTVEGKTVVSDMYFYKESKGIDLTTVLEFLKSKDLVMDWLDYIKCALLKGANPKNLETSILTSVGEVYGSAYAEEIKKKFNPALSGSGEKEKE